MLRAVEPLNFESNTKGPGLLTKALSINKGLHKKKIGGEIFIEKTNEKIDIVEGFRIGIKNDLPEKLRFYIKGNGFVSRK